MTGLDSHSDLILEIATIVTDDELNIVAESPIYVISAPEEVLGRMNPTVTAMHTTNGLIEAVRHSNTSLQDASSATLSFLKTHIPHKGQVPLCGNSIGTDRRFLARYMPEVEEWLHYRSVDVSSVKELAKRWYPETLAHMPPKAVGHRALDDIRESISELRFYREFIFRDSNPS